MIHMLLLAIFVFIGHTAAFGAGNIPSYGALEGKAFRHGDIEDILLALSMVPVAAGAAGFLSSLNPLTSSGKKFNAMAVKRVYFGNYLRDMSQAIDVGTLSKGLDSETIMLLVWVMSFMAFGYATEEFEVTEARLGVYRPEEHIDNPKGYPSPTEPDARKYDGRLRGPVEEIELAIDPETGLKNYICNESGHWMTSSAFIRNTLLRCIELGRAYRQGAGQDTKYESLRLLGQALHTLEDFSAHSNYCELTLIELGHVQVFPHVGTSTRINLHGHQVFPLTTGTFGGLDFTHSLLGEATDKISQTQISEVAGGLDSSAGQSSFALLNTLQSLTSSLPGSSFSRELEDMQGVSREADGLRGSDRSSIGMADLSPREIASKIYPVMRFRDNLVKRISSMLDKIPGLSALLDQITEALTIWVLSTIEPFMKPIVAKVTAGLGAGQALVTSQEDQLVVFDDPLSTNPSHSMLAKDHFSCYLNQPAGLIAQAIVKHTVSRVTQAWSDPRLDPVALVAEVLEAFHHPAYARGHTSIQSEMRNVVISWLQGLGIEKERILNCLTFDSVKQGLHHEGGTPSTTGVGANHSHAHHSPSREQNFTQSRHDQSSNYRTETHRNAGRQQHVNQSYARYSQTGPENYADGQADSRRQFAPGSFGQTQSYPPEQTAGAGVSIYNPDMPRQEVGYNRQSMQSSQMTYGDPGDWTRPNSRGQAYPPSNEQYNSAATYQGMVSQNYSQEYDQQYSRRDAPGIGQSTDNSFDQVYGSGHVSGPQNSQDSYHSSYRRPSNDDGQLISGSTAYQAMNSPQQSGFESGPGDPNRRYGANYGHHYNK